MSPAYVDLSHDIGKEPQTLPPTNPKAIQQATTYVPTRSINYPMLSFFVALTVLFILLTSLVAKGYRRGASPEA